MAAQADRQLAALVGTERFGRRTQVELVRAQAVEAVVPTEREHQPLVVQAGFTVQVAAEAQVQQELLVQAVPLRQASSLSPTRLVRLVRQ